MKLYSSNDEYKLYEGNMLDTLEVIEPNSIDSIITDPPYELNFMNKGWDNSGVAFKKETWQKCYEVLKSGGYLLAFGGSRTFHRIACAIEDAGFEIRDTIMWLYGCLSEDTEVLTKNGFKQFHKITSSDMIRVYDIENGIYKWEKPQRWNVYKTEQDTCFRIKSDSTDQLVSRNHRCLIERDGKLVFEYAENLGKMERVPILSYDIPYVQESDGNILFTDLLWQNEGLVKEIFSEWEGKEKPEEISLWGNKLIMERWCDLSQEKRELCLSKYKVCEVPERIYNDGEKRWLCDGASSISGTGNSTTFIKDGSYSSYQSQCRGQQIGKSDVVCDKSRPQELREWKTYQTTLATVTKEEYSGIIYCPTVSTGCFVARRNGKVFITGNSGFPKSLNIGLAIDKKNGVESAVVGNAKSGLSSRAYQSEETTTAGNYDIKEAQNEWKGWGTALKPSYEPIIVARKPVENTVVDNVLKYGVGGINIDECRVGNEERFNQSATIGKDGIYNWNTTTNINDEYKGQVVNGRFPANTILTYDETDFKEVCGGFPYTSSKESMPNKEYSNTDSVVNFVGTPFKSGYLYEDNGSASRYFYCAKASKKDRDDGLENFSIQKTGELQGGRTEGSAGSLRIRADGSIGVNPYAGNGSPKKNIHPTVKPTELMQYLIRLVTPKGGTILDPFNGSGSTGKAVMYENAEKDKGYKYIGIELTDEYLPISKARIESVYSKKTQTSLF